ncbi:MAG: protein kinase domain-containing protein, partial [Polyangiaceae bacterium]
MGVVHRDLKPENIMVMKGTDDEGNPKDLVKVCDFGIAKIVSRATDLSKSESGLGPKLTTAGLVVGTPEYMSPEQGRGEALDARSDIYSMGIIMFQLLTSRVPFEAETALGVVLKHVTDEPPRPSSMVPSTDRRLEAICLRAMEKKREARYQTAREMRAELRALQGESLSQVSLRAPPHPRGDRFSLPTAATEVAFDSGAVRAGAGAFPQAERTQSKVTPLGTELDEAVLPRRRWAGLAIAAILLGATATVIGARIMASRQANADVAAASAMATSSAPPTPASVTPVDDTNDVAPLESATASHAHHPKAPRVDPGPTEVPVSTGSATPLPPAGAYDPIHARVAIAGITPRNTDNRSVRQVINLKDFSDCYRGGLVGVKTRPPIVHDTLKLQTDDQGRITGAFLEGPKTAGTGGKCILDSMLGKTLGGSGVVGADVDLEFLPGDAKEQQQPPPPP